MTRASTADLVADAAARATGVAAFNVITLEHAEGIVLGAARAGAPAILQISQNAIAFHGGDPAPLVAACVAVADGCEVPVAVHIDHLTDPDLMHRCAVPGVSSVMFDAGASAYDDNVSSTGAAVAWAHGQGLWLEAELGFVGGKPEQPASAHAAGVRTDPDEAAAYVHATGVDALAVAVGSSHAMTARTATIDVDLVAAIAARLSVPLVLHGSSGVPDAQLRAAIDAGMTKINVGTALNVAMTEAVRACLAQDADLIDPRRYLQPARAAIADEVARLLGVIAG